MLCPRGLPLSVLALAAPAVVLAREPRPAASTLAVAIDRIIERPAFAPAFWGIEVRDLRSGRVLYARNASKNLTPASTMKLVTTAAALDALGPEARFRTTVESAGLLDPSGRLSGDLYLVGRGDPGLAERAAEGRTAFDVFADALWAAGVRSVEGRVVGHEGLFKGDRRGASWQWDDLVWCYGAEVAALSWNTSCANVTVSPGTRPGEPALVTRDPASSYYEVVSTVVTAAAGQKSDLTLVRDLGSSVIHLSGSYTLGAEADVLEVALEDPARYAVTVFAERLASRGIHVSGAVATSSEALPLGLRVLASRDSEPLSEILKKTNKASNNFKAESLLRLVGLQAKGEGSTSAGLEAVGDFLKQSGVDIGSAAIGDGSGMAPTDLLAPHQIVDLLVAMDAHRHAQAFRDSLPVAGVDGTLEHRMRGTRAERRVVAKTGTRRHANALAGYVTTLSGGRLAFSMAVGNHTVPSREATAAIDAICNVLVGVR
jgi:D-alanyl-D-alanine carboxypeptidase/D-alanyl-D-alanine-endopeptidase (penicillin-binding protein 4)